MGIDSYVKKIEKWIKIILVGFVICMGAYLYTKPEVTSGESHILTFAALGLATMLSWSRNDK